MQLKECMEDTADNKVWGDRMLINLCVLCAVQYFCLSSSLWSCSWLSRPPLKGMTKAPGSWLSTHSLIFTSLVNTAATTPVGGLDWNRSICYLLAHAYSWEQLNIWVFAGDCTPQEAFLSEFDFSFLKSFQPNVWWESLQEADSQLKCAVPK